MLYLGEHYEVENNVAIKYIFGGNLRLAQIKGSLTSYFHKDHLGSTAAITDQNGNKVEGTHYEPFGATRTQEGTPVSSYKFTDQELDNETNLYNYDARLYDPVLGMFVTPDSIVPHPYDPQSLNRYAYCRNNPLIYTDPTGHVDTEGDGPKVPEGRISCPNVVDPKDRTRVKTNFGEELEKLRKIQQEEEQRAIIIAIVGKKAFKVTIIERGTKMGPTFGGQIVVETDDGRVIVVDGSSWPNPKGKSSKAPGIAPGKGQAKYSKTGHKNGTLPGFRLEDGGPVATIGPNPAQGGKKFADGVNIHASDTDDWRGSSNCQTIKSSQASDVWNHMEDYEGKWGSWELIR